MLFTILSIASLGTISLLSSSVAAAPTTASDIQIAVPIEPTTSGENVSHDGGLSKRTNPNVFTYAHSSSCGGDWVSYSLGPGCWKVQNFDSFSPTNNPGCVVRAYQGDYCGGNGIQFAGNANGQGIRNAIRQPSGQTFIYTASTIGVTC
ncbi:hypothetical protein GQ44DRAFT_731912 [Phaeosphaeriaceae sp. PMI808]|nr:hypothetical protein GQ44DRAFT_731912 [Phaeosphaeriaceae sp. PMI808]